MSICSILHLYLLKNVTATSINIHTTGAFGSYFMMYSKEPGMWCHLIAHLQIWLLLRHGGPPYLQLGWLIAHLHIELLLCYGGPPYSPVVGFFFFVRLCHVLLFFLANIINCLHLECLSAFDWGSVQFNCITFNRSSSSFNF